MGTLLAALTMQRNRQTAATSIDLSGKGLTGEIDSAVTAELLKYTNAVVIDLSHNRITGKLPSAAFPKANRIVTDIYLNHNKFYGPIPTALFEMPKLNVLDLSHNMLEGSVVIATRTPELKEFYLSYNMLRGNIDDLAKEVNLTHLWLDNNYFTGILSPKFKALDELVVLMLQNNDFTGSIPLSWGQEWKAGKYVSSGMKKLTHLGLQGTKVTWPVKGLLGDSLALNLQQGNIIEYR